MRLIAVGKLRASPEAELFARYNARLHPPLKVIETAEARSATNAQEIRQREARDLLAALPGAALSIALDLGGTAETSEDLAKRLARWQESGRTPCFLIGGAEGLDGTVLARADHVLSLGPCTWPHLLVRALLAEQLYRAQAILAGHPYHRGARP